MSSGYENLSQAELIKLLQNTTAQLDRANKDISIVQSKLNSAEKKLTTTEKKLTTTEKKLTTTEKKLTTTEKKLTTTEKQLTTTEKQLTTTEKQLTTTEKKLTTTENRLNRTVKKLEKTQQENEDLKSTNKTLCFIASNFTQDAHAILHEIDKKFTIYPQDAFSRDVITTIQNIFEECLSCVKNYKSAFSNSCFAPKGSDVGSISSAATNNEEKNNVQSQDGNNSQDNDNIVSEINNIKEQMANLNGSYKNQSRHFERIKTLARSVYEYCVKNGMTERATELENILKTLEIKPKHSNKRGGSTQGNGKKTRGRQKTGNLNNAKGRNSQNKIDKCSKCDSDDVINLKTEVSTFIRQSSDLRDAIDAVSQGNDIYVCKKCGTCEMAFDKDKDDFPVIPNRSIGMSLIRSICQFEYNGIPVDRFNSWLTKGFELGHDTLPYNVSDYVAIYLNPLYEMIYNKAKTLKVLLADETVFDCLHSQGKGNMSAKMKECRDKGQLEINSRNYILTLASAPASDVKLVYFTYVNSRSTESLGNVITDDFKFEYLVSDAYPVYASISQRLERRKWQTCITHFRREIIKACNPRVYAQDLEKLTEQELTEKLLRDFEPEQMNAPAALLKIFYAIAKIYELESAYQNDGSIDRNTYINYKLENREQMKDLFESIDAAVESIKDRYVELTRTGKYRAKSKSSLYAKPLIYYLNHKDSFTTFIENVEVPPDSNHVENMIRRMTMIRSSVKQKVSAHNMQDLCKIVTVYKTLELNGIDTESYLRRLNNSMYAHCINKAMTQYYMDNGELPKGQIKS